jgi:hypothetical protein
MLNMWDSTFEGLFSSLKDYLYNKHKEHFL